MNYYKSQILKLAVGFFCCFPLVMVSACASSRHYERISRCEARLVELTELTARLSRQISELERRISEMDNSIFILNDLIDSNSQALKELKEKGVEIQRYSSAQAPALSSSSNLLFQGSENFPSRSSTKSTTSSKVLPASTDPYLYYREIYEYFRSGQLDKAREGFSRFVEFFPRHELSDNALYWLGECYYGEKDYITAAKIFEQVYREYPQENKAPDALLKWFFSLLALGERDKAGEVFRMLNEKYPHSEAVQRAKKKLSE